LGRPPAPDVDDPVLVGPLDGGDGLDHRLRGSSKLRRATLLLRYRAGLGDDEIARTVGSTPDGIAAYLAHVLGDLGVGSDGYTEDDVRDRLARHREAVAEDLARVDGHDGAAVGEGFAWVDIVGPDHLPTAPPSAAQATPPAAGPQSDANPLLDVLTESLEGTPAASEAGGEPAPSGRSRRRRRWVWLGLGLLILATFAVALALVIGTRSDPAGGQTRAAHRPQVRSAPAVPTASVVARLPSPIGAQLPGTRVLGDFAGAGARTLGAAPAAPRPGFQLAVGLGCRGAGPVRAASVVLTDCTLPAVGPVPAGSGPLAVQAPAGTRWRAVLVEQPVVDTSGSLRSPADPSLADPDQPDVVAAAHGTGVATVGLRPAGPGRHALRVSLLCRGPGVELSGADHAVDGSYARDCLPGWSYEFDLTAVPLPAQLRVVPAPGTTWQLTVTLR
ncbi:MAG: hypothetical protein J0H43_15455, partial [Actinobacteria bacterium]|nr:hypothetical protein [Actinomycetota bacterium]